MIASLLRKLQYQSKEQLKQRKPEMINSLKKLGKFSCQNKVGKILKGSLDLITNHLHLLRKFKLWAGKFDLGVNAKHCWVMSTNFL